MARDLAGLQPEDVLYNALPLYHSSAGMLALAPCYLYGLTVVLKPKFSVSSFWKDCVRYKATVSLGHMSLGIWTSKIFGGCLFIFTNDTNCLCLWSIIGISLLREVVLQL